jgi:hypothetical protein
MVDYSKFNGIGDSDEEEEFSTPYSSPSMIPFQTPPAQQLTPVPSVPSSSASVVPDKPTTSKKTKKGKDGRIQFEYDGKLIYEWEQNLTEVIIYVPPPPGVSKKQLDIRITPHHLTVGMKGLPPYIDEETGGMVRVDESMWMLTDGELVINLQKMNKAEAWDCALQGSQARKNIPNQGKLDDYTKEEVKKQLLLERFQEEVSELQLHLLLSHSLVWYLSSFSSFFIFPSSLCTVASRI